MIDKAAIDAKAKALGLTPSQVTPTIRMAIANMMVQERWIDFYQKYDAIAPK
jgi:hypothetical protein